MKLLSEQHQKESPSLEKNTSDSLEAWISWIEKNEIEEPEFIEKCKEQFKKEGSTTDILKFFGVMSTYDHGLIPIIEGLTLYTFIDDGMLAGIFLSAKLIGLKKAFAYFLTLGLQKTVCSKMGVTPAQATRVMVPWLGTGLLSQFALRQSPELHKMTQNYWLHRKKFRKMLKEKLPEKTLEREKTLKKDIAWRQQFNVKTFVSNIISDQGFPTPSFKLITLKDGEGEDLEWEWEEATTAD